MAWTPTTTTDADWGQIRVAIDGKDRTFFRDIETVVVGWQDTDPYGSNNATLRFPQVSEFDNVGAGDLAWLAEGKRMRIDHHLDGVRVKTLFLGFISRVELGDDGVTATCTGDLLGYLSLTLHQPPIGRRQVRDVGEAISRTLGTYDGMGTRYKLIPQRGLVTGTDVAIRGDRGMTRLGFVDYCLAQAVKRDGSSLTILPDPDEGPRFYRMQWRDLTTVHASGLSAGAHGVKVRLSKDIVDHPNRIFGEGVAPNGERWRNAIYPNLGDKTVPVFPTVGGQPMALGDTDADTSTGDGVTVMVRELWGNGTLEADDKGEHEITADVVEAIEETQENAGLAVTGTVTQATWNAIFSADQPDQNFAGARFLPLSQASDTHYFQWAGDGTVIGLNPNADPKTIRVDEFVSYGEGVHKRQAKRNAKARRLHSGGWTGTVTLTQDPAEMSRFDLRAGMNLRLDNLRGFNPGELLHISSVQVDWQAGSVTLAVSTKGRHFWDLATARQRDREARMDPGAHFRHMLSRKSAHTLDTISGWEGESGAGIIRPTAITGGSWHVLKFVAAELGTMSQMRLFAEDNPTTFYAAVFADKVHPGILDARLGNPSVWIDEEEREDVWLHNADWLVEDERLMIEAWGTPDQPCGLGMKPYLNRSGNRSKWPVTGKFLDNGSWDFWTTNNFLFLAVWASADTTIRGRCRIQLNDGM